MHSRLSPPYGSQTFLSTMTSVTDSVAANALITRFSSPADLSTSPPNSTNGSIDGDAMAAACSGEQLTGEKMERLVQEEAGLRRGSITP
jgi:translation initiation factor 4E